MRAWCAVALETRIGSTPSLAQPAGHHEKIGIGDGIAFAHHPRAGEHLLLDQHEAVGHRLRHLGLHRLVGGGIVGPAAATPAMGVVHMHGRADVVVEGLQTGEFEGIVERGKPAAGAIAAMYARIADVSVTTPCSVASAGTRPFGLIFRKPPASAARLPRNESSLPRRQAQIPRER
jgi:hypothetical protein